MKEKTGEKPRRTPVERAWSRPGKMAEKKSRNRPGLRGCVLVMLLLMALLPAGEGFAEELEAKITSGILTWNKISWADEYHYSVRLEGADDAYGTTTSLSVDIDAFIDGLIESGKIKNTGEHQLYLEAYNTETFETLTWWGNGPYKHFHPSLPPYEAPEGPVMKLAESAEYDSSAGILRWKEYSGLAAVYWVDVEDSGSVSVPASGDLSFPIRKEINERVSNGTLDYAESFLVTLTANKADGTELDRWQETIHLKPEITPIQLTAENTATGGVEAEYPYTGEAIRPEIQNLSVQGKVLKAGKDYTVSYGKNTEPGEGTVKISGEGRYAGSFTIGFRIVKEQKPLQVSVSDGMLRWKAYSGAASYSYGAGGSFRTTTETSVNIHAYIDELISTDTIPKTASYLVEVEAYDASGARLVNWSETIQYASAANAGSGPADASVEPEEKVYAASVITPDKPAKLTTIQKRILGTENEKDVKGSSFSILQAEGAAKSRTSIQITWKTVKGAKKYIIYGNRCGKGKKFKKLDTLGKNKTSWTKKKLKKGTYYKVIVAAVKGKKVLAVSSTIHVSTDGGKKGNPSSVSLKKKAVTLSPGKSVKLKASVKTGKLSAASHRKLAWESDNVKVAKVSSKGKITGVGEGTCHVYAYTQNGICAMADVTVK